MSDRPVTFGLVGGSSFRAQYYLRVARELPERFAVAGLVVRDAERGRDLAQRWGIPVHPSAEALLAGTDLDFVVASVAGSAMPEVLERLAGAGVPVLAETPPAPDLPRLVSLHERLTATGARLQVAEQYPLHPSQRARLAYLATGALGRVTQATVSVSHGYHAMALLRAYLGVGFASPVVTAMRFTSPWVQGPTRAGPPEVERVVDSTRELAWLDFGGALGVYDFTTDQHRSWIRSSHVEVRGERGEVFDDRVSVLADHRTPVHLDLRRVTRGVGDDHEGHFMRGVLAGERWVYENPVAPARLFDDEIAVASCLLGMAAWCAGGEELYSLAQACQDQYLALALREALDTGRPVATAPQVWSPEA